MTHAKVELDKIMEDTDMKIATVREFLSSFTSRALLIGAAGSENSPRCESSGFKQNEGGTS